MKRHTISMTMSVLILTIILLPASVFSQDTPSVTGAGAAAFPNGTIFSVVPVSGLTFGVGVFIYSDGSAAGQFEATLLGTSLLGQPQNIEVEGTAATGVLNADGSRTFSGTATLDIGDGTPPLTSVPFTLTASTTSVLLVLNSINLPSAALTDGQITMR
jgi:hypothetical protein